MSVVCELGAPFVATSAVDDKPVARPFRRHAESCLKCQARHAAMAKAARELAAMAGENQEAPRDLEWRVMSSLDGELAVARSLRKPVALVAAALSMAAALIIWRLRPRPQS
jgi:hypothetical protein